MAMRSASVTVMELRTEGWGLGAGGMTAWSWEQLFFGSA